MPLELTHKSTYAVNVFLHILFLLKYKSRINLSQKCKCDRNFRTMFRVNTMVEEKHCETLFYQTYCYTRQIHPSVCISVCIYM